MSDNRSSLVSGAGDKGTMIERGGEKTSGRVEMITGMASYIGALAAATTTVAVEIARNLQAGMYNTLTGIGAEIEIQPSTARMVGASIIVGAIGFGLINIGSHKMYVEELERPVSINTLE